MTDTSACVLTTWPTQVEGYGFAMRDRQMWLAHRYAWTRARGPIPDGMCVLHHCDNPPCVRVTPLRHDGTPDPDDHLWLGTRADNNRDRHTKGRDSHVGSPRGPRAAVTGARNPRARLTEANVRDIRARLARGDRLADLGRDYGVSPETIGAISSRRSWAHVT